MFTNTIKSTITGASMLFLSACAFAQLPVDGFYPKKSTLTAALSYDYKSYDDFYFGKSLNGGTPAGLGEITSSVISIYAQYGVTDRLSFTVTLPYISTSSENNVDDPFLLDSTISGLQDLGFFVKGLISDKVFENSSKFSLGGAIGVTFPVGDYDGRGVLSLGNESTSYKAETILHYETNFGLFFETKFGSSVSSSDQFEIPSALLYSGKIGYIHKYFYIHSELDIQNSVTGFDIGSPEFVAGRELEALPETEVDYTRLLFNVYVPFYKNTLGVSTNYLTTLDGRNVNDDSSFGIGLVYNFN